MHAFLVARFPGAPLHLPAQGYLDLVTRDQRARLTYDRLRVPCEFLGDS